MTWILAICLGWPAVAVALAIGLGRAIRLRDQPTCPDTVPAWMTAEVGA